MPKLLISLTARGPALAEPMQQTLERDWHQDIMVMLRDRAPKVVATLLILFLLSRLATYAVRRMQKLAARQSATPKKAAQLRTLATIVRGTCWSAIGFLAFLQVLTLFNIDYKPLLASAGIIGVGIGLGAQSLFKDIINGIFILVEDQYNVGEVVRVAGLTGTVEDLTLRLTRLRDGDGTLYVIPNSQVATVSNLSRDYAVASLPVAVDASANPDRIITLLGQIAAEVKSDDAFKDVIVGDATVLGVDKIDGRSIIYPVNLRVKPNQKDGVLRELRRRIVLRFEREGIPLGSDASLLIMQAAKGIPADPTTPPPQGITLGG